MANCQRSENADWVREQHPCFGAKKNSHGRLHLPVCGSCNISCNFCARKINSDENRPGVTSRILSPDECVGVVERALALCPTISVVGIAGPGDTLASDAAIDSFRLVGDHFPELLKCMSTNGLLLADRVDDIIGIGLNSLTVTVNAVDPAILADIVDHIYYQGRIYRGLEAAEILIRNQLAGLKAIKKAGVVVKVNTVLVAELNLNHISDIARAVAETGVDMYNIIPLIPQHKMAHFAPTNCDDLRVAREMAEEYVPVFRHCQRCRADAIGVPGESDFSRQIYQRNLLSMEIFSHG